MILDDLKKPLRPHEIEWRVGSTTKDGSKGMALAYMDARAVANRLDEVCGPENWQNRFSHAGQKTCCEIGILTVNSNADQGLFQREWVWKSDGAGDTDFEGEKGAFSDAFKRAATKWGIGRYLYDIETPWVPIENRRFTKEALTILNKAYRDAIWVGPLGITALKNALKAFVGHLNSAQSSNDIDALVSANSGILEQCRIDEPSWFYGNDDVPSIDERITGKREELTMKEAS